MCLRTAQQAHKYVLFNDILLFINGNEVTVELPLESVWVYDLGKKDPQTALDNALEVCCGVYFCNQY